MLDPWEHLGPKRRQLLENSWAGLFRQEILAELPVDQIAPWFRADFGRPSKELYTVLGVLLLQQMHDLTDAETVQQLAFHQQWHYALNITEEGDAAKYLCPKTLWSIRQQVTDQELAPVLFDQVTEKLARVFQVDPSKQRLRCTLTKKVQHAASGPTGTGGRMSAPVFGQSQAATCRTLCWPGAGAGTRYLGKKALGCFSPVKPSEYAQKLASVGQEAFLLVERFQGHPEVAKMVSYRMLHRVLHEHCEVKPAADSAPGEVVAPVTGPPPAAGFSLADFQMSPAGLVLACPQGEAPRATNCRKHRYRVAFSSPRGHACPQRSRCPVKPGEHYHYRRYKEEIRRLQPD